VGQQAQAYLKDAYRAIADFFSQGKTFDFIFLDPPYHRGMVRITLQTLEEYDILAPSGYIIAFCYAKDDFIKESSKFSLIAERKYGQTLLLIYRKK
jgi:16S rRNA G966 N2-methylase RsmD